MTKIDYTDKPGWRDGAIAGWNYDGFSIMQEELGEKPESIEQAAYWAMRSWLLDKAEELTKEGKVTL